MGLGKKLTTERSSFDSLISGSVGWQAPELLGGGAGVMQMTGNGGAAQGGRLTKAVDTFSAGCVIYYVLTKGGHPYGTWYCSTLPCCVVTPC